MPGGIGRGLLPRFKTASIMWARCRLSPLGTGSCCPSQRRRFASFLLLTSLLCLIEEAHAASTRVAGLGVGLFLLIFFGVLALLCCCIGFHSHKPWIFIAPSTCILIIVMLVLLLARREPTEAEAQETTSSKKLAMYLITFMMAVCAVCAFVSMLINEWTVPLQAHAYAGADIEAKGNQRKFG